MLKKLLRKLKRKIFKKIKIPIYIKISEKDLFKGQTALIFGGSGGIGLAIAKRLSSNGCRVITVGRNIEKLDAIKKDNSDLITEAFDLNDFENYQLFLEKIKVKYGNINSLVISQGVHILNPSFEKINFVDFDKVTNLDLKAAYFLIQKFSAVFDNKTLKKILVISSSRGFEPAWTPYGTAKAGLNSLIKGLAKELYAKNIIINGISPGVVATKLINYETNSDISSEENICERLIMPEEVASLANFLLSSEANMIVGENILISGGRGSFDIR